MAVEYVVRARLAAVTAITDIVDTRIYPSLLPQDVTLPAITYHKVSAPHAHAFGSDAGLSNPRYQIDVWAETYKGVVALSAAVRGGLSRYREIIEQDGYAFSNGVGGTVIGNGGVVVARAQSFRAAVAYPVNEVVFEMDRIGSPSSSMTASIYATTGTHGTNAVPTGTALATSDTILASTLVVGSFRKAHFGFPSPMTPALNTTYACAVGFSESVSNHVRILVDSSSPTHSGNSSSLSAGWNSGSAFDLTFSVRFATIQDTLLLNELDIYEQGRQIHRIMMDFEVWHTE